MLHAASAARLRRSVSVAALEEVRQMQNQQAIREHMEVIGADGGHVGTVDSVEGERIKLTRGDRGAGGQHHWLPLSLVAEVEGNRVRLSTTLDSVIEFWDSGAMQPPSAGDDASRSGQQGQAMNSAGRQRSPE
jgi:hypothetical protein